MLVKKFRAGKRTFTFLLRTDVSTIIIAFLKIQYSNPFLFNICAYLMKECVLYNYNHHPYLFWHQKMCSNSRNLLSVVSQFFEDWKDSPLPPPHPHFLFLFFKF